MDFTKNLGHLVEKYHGFKNIPDINLKKLHGFDPHKDISRDQLNLMTRDRYHKDRNLLNETDEFLNDDGDHESSGQPHQQIRNQIREDILNPLIDSGDLKDNGRRI